MIRDYTIRIKNFTKKWKIKDLTFNRVGIKARELSFKRR